MSPARSQPRPQKGVGTWARLTELAATSDHNAARTIRDVGLAEAEAAIAVVREAANGR